MRQKPQTQRPRANVYDHWDYPGPGHVGSLHSVSGDYADQDRVEALRDVVEEVTGKPVPRQRRRMGFI